MKTNQTLAVAFRHGIVHVEHKTLMGDVRELFAVGNAYRKARGLAEVDFRSWRTAARTVEFEAVVSKRIGRPAIQGGRGRNGRTKAHLLMLLDAAAWADPEFKADVYEVFVSYKLAQIRDMGGDAFIELNAALADTAMEALGRPAHKGHYISLAKIIRARCGVTDWNAATPGQLERRLRIEDRLSSLLHLGMVRSWDHLKLLADMV